MAGSYSLIYGQDALVAEFVKQRIPHAQHGFDKCVTIGVEQDGELIAGIVFFDWFPAWGNIYVAVAGEGNWCTRRLLRRCYAFPFVQMQCKRVTVLIADNNRAAIELVMRIGFQLEGILRGDPNCLVFGLLKAEAMKWA
jgi:RimJ/RimL family protein N-acetyltransferase